MLLNWQLKRMRRLDRKSGKLRFPCQQSSRTRKNGTLETPYAYWNPALRVMLMTGVWNVAIPAHIGSSHWCRYCGAAFGHCGDFRPQGLPQPCHVWNGVFSVHADPCRNRNIHRIHQVSTRQYSRRPADALHDRNGMDITRRRDMHTGIFDWVALLFALSIGTACIAYGFRPPTVMC